MSIPKPFLFKGPLARRFFYEYRLDRQYEKREDFLWTTNVKPGDLVNCCDYWNRAVVNIEHTYGVIIKDKEFGLCVEHWVTKNLEKYPNLVWLETTFTFTDGCQHSTGGGCAVPAWTAEQVREHQPDCDEHGCKPQ
jgi:hypothetical protein